MSYVFDALQRFESERPGVEPAALSTAFAVLEAAERKAAASPGPAWRTASARLTESANGRPAIAVGAALSSIGAEAVLPPAERDGEDNPGELDFFRRVDVSIGPDARLICLSAPESLAAEKFRYLGVRLQEIRLTRQLKSVLLTSAIPQEGKSMVSANLACSLASTTGDKVLLLGGDLRRPTVSGMFGVGGIAGLTECLQGKQTLKDSIVRLDAANLWFLTAGSGSTSPLQLLQSGGLPEIMNQLAGWFDWIIVDSAPALPMADTSTWMRLVDGIVLVARPGITESSRLESTLKAIDPKKLVGAVLNCSKRRGDDAYYYKGSAAAL